MHYVQSQRHCKKCTYRGMGVVVCTYTISFPWEMETFALLSTAYISFYLLNFKFLKERIRPVLDNYDNKIVRMSLDSFDLLLKVACCSPRLLIYLKHNNYIPGKKLVLGERKNGYYRNPIKGQV